MPCSLSKGDCGNESLEPCQSVSSSKCDETWTRPVLENNLTYTGAYKWITDRAYRIAQGPPLSVMWHLEGSLGETGSMYVCGLAPLLCT